MSMLRLITLTAFVTIFSFFLPFPEFFVRAEKVTAPTLVVRAPWARASIGTRRPGGAFAIIRNQGEVADKLIGIETPVSGRAEIHRTQISNGIASMAPAGPVKIPANNEVRLAPGGLHIMLMKLTKPLIKGKSFPLTLIFEKAGRIEVTVPILGVGARGPQKSN